MSIIEDIKKLESAEDSIYGTSYRGAAILRDGTEIPCLIFKSKQKIVDLAKRRIKEELNGNGRLGGDDPYGQIVTVFAAGGNKVNDYDISKVIPSRYAIPDALRSKIHGETFMGWTGWVFEMNDGKLFQFGSAFSFDYFDMPKGYDFDDVKEVHNHSYLNDSGKLCKLRQGAFPPEDYKLENVFREKVSFECAIDGI
ncbi:hypothetical protein ACFOEK_03240 [Litoribrevibacter euphylliae]|uniref:Uncharacterized protein n=1 Tax=Litoribrevibacter euphylliae TaxID=1834034 RepID=A0ABV7HBG2_9GAMM